MFNNFQEVINQYGTPVYLYDFEMIRTKYLQFQSSFQVSKLDIHYAMKALSNINILKLMKSLGAKLDCVSIQEIELAFLAGYKPENILFTPNGISIEEYRMAIKHGVKINIDNLQMIEVIASEFPSLSFGVRLNPHIMGGGNSKISVGHIDSKFGISIHQLPHLERLIKEYKLNIEGIHIHTGSDILDPEIFIRAAKMVFNAVRRIESIEYIDFGSGFKVAYKEGDLFTDMSKFGIEFSQVYNDFCKEMGREYTLKFEPGKFLVSEAGSFLVKVNVVKQTTSCTFVHIDSGFNHLIRPMFYNSFHKIENLSNPEGEPKLYNVVGYICESDTFASDRRIPEIRKGDILQFKNAGAYCFQMASNYNSRFLPPEVAIEKGGHRLIRERGTMEDIVRGQVF